jgi:hypothetical protein
MPAAAAPKVEADQGHERPLHPKLRTIVDVRTGTAPTGSGEQRHADDQVCRPPESPGNASASGDVTWQDPETLLVASVPILGIGKGDSAALVPKDNPNREPFSVLSRPLTGCQAKLTAWKPGWVPVSGP